MTVEEVRQTVIRIAAMVGDNESAHMEEDDLWVAVLKTIAAGAPNPAELAQEALKTLKIDFTHWYA